MDNLVRSYIDGDIFPDLDAELVENAGLRGNARLTAATGGFLLILVAAQGLTLLSVDRLLTWHEFIGMVLVGPVVLKLSSTGYRFTGYYRHRPAYVRQGPPHPVMRALAPFLVLATVNLFGSGIALYVVGHDVGPLLLVHQVSFVAWVALVAVHVVVYARRVPRLAGPDLRRRRPGDLPGARQRRRALAASILGGVLLATLTVGTGATFQGHHDGDHGAQAAPSRR